MIYNFYIFNRKGKCLYYQEWSRPQVCARKHFVRLARRRESVSLPRDIALTCVCALMLPPLSERAERRPGGGAQAHVRAALLDQIDV